MAIEWLIEYAWEWFAFFTHCFYFVISTWAFKCALIGGCCLAIATPVLYYYRKLWFPTFLELKKKAVKYLVYTKHPLGPLFYIFSTVTGYYITYTQMMDIYLPSPYVGDYHKQLSFVLVLIAWGTFACAYFSDPGRITPKTAPLLCKIHPYDGILYKHENKCTTCDIIRPARSKHCSLCDICVPYFDHHCVWINTCVAQNNFLQFLAFSFYHAFILCYASVILFLI